MDLTPKEFELLLCEFCKQDLPSNFTVEHDIKDIGGESGNKRQIDTKIRGRIGVSNILICGEAKNWNEAVGSETIDALVGKYFSFEIPANKVIVFSNLGYAAPAVTRGKLRGIELIEPEELGKPIRPIPYIVGVGYLGQMEITTSHNTPQENIMSIDPNNYIILKGDERISFQQNVFRIVRNKLREIKNKNIFTPLSTIMIEDKNVLYELKNKEGYKYNADFEIKVSLIWEFNVEHLTVGILRHLNTDEIKIIHLNGNADETLSKILLSDTKKKYTREDCISEIVEKSTHNSFKLCIVDPDRMKTNPESPLISFV